MPYTLQQIEQQAANHAKAHTALMQVTVDLKAELEGVQKRYKTKLNKAIAEAAASETALLDMVAESPKVFQKPKSQVLHGIKCGFKKSKGKIVITDEAQTIKLIRKQLPDLAAVLIVTTETPSKEAMNSLDAAQLKKIGVTVTADTDVAFITDPASETDKLVAALMKSMTEEVAA